MSKKNKQKNKLWPELRDVKCPNCKQSMMKDMFSNKLLGCACGFVIKEETKDLLVNRDHNVKN